MPSIPIHGRTTTAAITLAMALTLVAQGLAVVAATPSSMVTGRVTVDGKAVRAAKIVIEVMPPLAHGATAKAGVPISMRVVGTTRSNAGGRFSLTPSAIPADAIDAFGAANLVATVSNGRKTIRWAFPFKVGGNHESVPSRPRTTIDLRFDLGARAGVADLDNPPSTWVGMSKVRLGADGLLAVAAEPGTGFRAEPRAAVCSFYWTSSYKYGISEAYADVWSWTGAKVTAHESLSSNHSLGIAVKNTSGAWSQGGSVSFGVSGESSIDTSGLWDNQVNNQVNYRQQRNTCSGTAEWWLPVSTYALNYPVLGWAHTLHPNWSSCATYGAGNTPTKQQGTNATFSAGVGFGPISLSAQAGWSTSISLKFNMTSTSRLCGSTPAGWVSSPQAEAHE